jgi:hypothetical protein
LKAGSGRLFYFTRYLNAAALPAFAPAAAMSYSGLRWLMECSTRMTANVNQTPTASS